VRRAVRRAAILCAAGQPSADKPYQQRDQRVAELSPSVPADLSPVTDGAIARDQLPSPLHHTPDLDAWIRFNVDQTVTVFTGKVELGQDLRTSLAMIAAEELGVSLNRILVSMADTHGSPNEGLTGSSMSLETSGNAIRYAAAEARHILLQEAHEELKVPLERLAVSDGTIRDPVSGRSVTYWQLHGDRRFGCLVSGVISPKQAAEYNLVGRPQQRLDLVAKVTGQHRFVHGIELPGMLHGRIVRPPAYDARLVSVDESAVAGMPGVVCVVRDGSFLGIIAEREETAVRALEALQASATWQNDTDLPPQDALIEHMLTQPEWAYLLVDGAPTPSPIPPVQAPPEAAQTLSATYFRPYHAHASLGPSAAVAVLQGNRLTIWSHTQGAYPLRERIARALGMPLQSVRCIHVDGAGSFGYNGANDAAFDAALLARAVPGRPVSLKWTRAQENAWESYGAAMVIQMQGSLDKEGGVIDWSHDVYGYAHGLPPAPKGDASPLLATWHMGKPSRQPRTGPILSPKGGTHRNALPLYTFCKGIPDRPRVGMHFLPDSPLRVAALRGLGSYANVFAMESFVDEIAVAAGVDPVAFRLTYLDEPRARDVIEAAAERANWQAAPRPRGEGRGRGFAFAQYKNSQVYMAAVVDLRVDRESGRIALERAVIAADAGQVVNPEGLSNQIEGAFTQSSSWTLKEEVTFERHGITSTDWRSYPILSFGEAPEIEVVLLNRPGSPYLGVGEGAMGPAPAAIANAVYDAVGVRLRCIPFTPARVKAALNGGA
jgi:CO/xanthine dehydrogenase Mo-binding subunit